jgi:hypothetical protein
MKDGCPWKDFYVCGHAECRLPSWDWRLWAIQLIESYDSWVANGDHANFVSLMQIAKERLHLP